MILTQQKTWYFLTCVLLVLMTVQTNTIRCFLSPAVPRQQRYSLNGAYNHRQVVRYAEPVKVMVESSLNQSEETNHNNNGSSSNPLGLTPELEKMVSAFERIGDDKLRYKQLLYMAGQVPSFDPTKQIPENKVPGCLSTVYIDGSAQLMDGTNDEYVIHFVGDSDGLLSKGLVAFLIRGLSGNTATAIQNIDPTFIQKAGISTSLTPGRNNGFLNMLAVMKRKALELEANAKSSGNSVQQTSDDTTSTSTEKSSHDDRPMYTAILNALQALKPEKVELVDVSYQHAGHVGTGGKTVETHFELYIVADAFDGLNLVKRHKLVYMMLGDIMPQIHALNINAKSPKEI
jgi:sulfur transfer protein SufE/stress-induced morphogen